MDRESRVGARKSAGRTRWRRFAVTGSLVIAVAAAACVPPPSVPAPDLPAEVGVRWLRDTGGTVGEGGGYVPALAAYTLLNGTSTGPLPFDWASFVPSPTLLDSLGFFNVFAFAPDGTARLPWNGFAGEGITLLAADPYEGDWTLEFPGGSCSPGSVGQYYIIQMISPSPDGTKVAIKWYDNDGASSIEVRALVDGEWCPTVVSARYQAQSGEGAGNALVWAPDSSAIAYRVNRGVYPANVSGIARLAASLGAVPVDVVVSSPSGPGRTLVPTGWSVDNRLLFSSVTFENGVPVSRLITRAVAGGPERVINTAALPTDFPGSLAPLTIGGLHQFLHYGYFVPGTSTIVYQHGSSSVTNSDGYTFPRFFVALEADADNATSKPILGSAPPLEWHEEARTVLFDPPYVLTDVPNAEFIDRFIR